MTSINPISIKHAKTLTVLTDTLVAQSLITEADSDRIRRQYHWDTLVPDLMPNAEARALTQRFMTARTQGQVVVHRRSSFGRDMMGRPVGQCYFNAEREYKQSKNRIAYVLTSMGGKNSDGFFCFMPHAINYDAKTGTYYDTTDLPNNPLGTSYTAYLITDLCRQFYDDKKQKKGDLTTVKVMSLMGKGQGRALDQTFGSFVCLHFGGRLYTFTANDHQNQENTDAHYKTFAFAEVVA
jgi:hypothetical protein